MKKILFLILLSFTLKVYGQSINKSFHDFDFVTGEKTLFEDNLNYNSGEKLLNKWILQGGKASIFDHQGDKCISIDEYYTKLKPVLFNQKPLPDSISIEYDTWLDNGYDGNPGIEIHLSNGDNEVLISPNKHNLSVSYPNDGKDSKENPTEYFGENKFYDRWVHISISLFKKQLRIYLDQYKMIEIADCRLKPQAIIVTGNTSQNMKILLKNFRIATSFRTNIAFENGKFATRAIKFDVNKSTLKPESIAILKQVYQYLVKNSSVKLEVGGHTDADGADDYNLKLSQQRVDAVKNELVNMGIEPSKLIAVGFGESKPLDLKNTTEAKATNRRVEFTIIK